jgi:hypothetical protein
MIDFVTTIKSLYNFQICWVCVFTQWSDSITFCFPAVASFSCDSASLALLSSFWDMDSIADIHASLKSKCYYQQITYTISLDYLSSSGST